jgi:general secretion pathway protein M
MIAPGNLPSGRAGQVVALCILGLVLATGYAVAVAPILDFYSTREVTLADRRTLALRLHDVFDELPSLRARLAELQTAATAHRITLDGVSDAIAAANLQSRIGELAASASVAIGSTEALAAENRLGYRRIGLRLAVRGEYAAIVKLLGAIEASTPPVVLANVRIRSLLRPTSEESNTRLEGGFEIYGFRSINSSAVLEQ